MKTSFPAQSTTLASPASGGVLPFIDEVMDAIFGSSSMSSPEPWALLDFPLHANVGDSAIWLGTLELLNPRFGAPPSYVTRNNEFPLYLDRILPQGPVLLHGGGNFGDMWRGFWQNRVAILTHYRHRRIVQMPQSVHFSDLDGEALRQTRLAIANHPDFTLIVRDCESLEFARAQFDCPVYLCPDMAFGLRQLAASAEPDIQILALMREDLERRDDGTAAAILSAKARVTDWTLNGKPPLVDRIIPHLARALLRLGPQWMAPLEAAFRRQAWWHLQRGVRILGQGEVVITDRLHGHILCCMMSKRHAVLDNSYGKITRYISAWPDDGLTVRAESAPDAIARLRDIN
ncbi:exopolysaccharide biosynthesis protein [Pseudotabrizicola sediminis]|uniref:Exopolysaccharide biosynthesis protein n=1 Tax=Pseudotabrizicola sediminis TaxID=2486418 RepID=A0ABY2KGR4_9RHOB|nr:polysaccharide pyruvyl transferase family protein [Pseudotabrizicola sediminis]TGD41405.1 exopolysaccharide biosynthesis protein [Pseudotabrizicola sediminis]